MFGKKKKPEERGVVCQECGLDCRDESSLQRHIDSVHIVGKSPATKS